MGDLEPEPETRGRERRRNARAMRARPGLRESQSRLSFAGTHGFLAWRGSGRA